MICISCQSFLSGLLIENEAGRGVGSKVEGEFAAANGDRLAAFLAAQVDGGGGLELRSARQRDGQLAGRGGLFPNT